MKKTAFEQWCSYIIEDAIEAAKHSIIGVEYKSKLPKMYATWHKYIAIEDINYTYKRHDIPHNLEIILKKGKQINTRTPAENGFSLLHNIQDKLQFVETWEQEI